jgi:hypothetical protein
VVNSHLVAALPLWEIRGLRALTKRSRPRMVSHGSDHQMCSRQTTLRALSPFLRCFAVGTLLVWLAAQTLCTAHCSLGVGRGQGAHASCHGPAAPQPDKGSPGPAPEGSSTTAACVTLKTVALSGGVVAWLVPGAHVLYTLAPVAQELVAAPEPDMAFPRQAWRRDWVFTPEVSLGPAFRSHAPPSIA